MCTSYIFFHIYIESNFRRCSKCEEGGKHCLSVFFPDTDGAGLDAAAQELLLMMLIPAAGGMIVVLAEGFHRVNVTMNS
jgi:hypothetical protein